MTLAVKKDNPLCNIFGNEMEARTTQILKCALDTSMYSTSQKNDSPLQKS